VFHPDFTVWAYWLDVLLLRLHLSSILSVLGLEFSRTRIKDILVGIPLKSLLWCHAMRVRRDTHSRNGTLMEECASFWLNGSLWQECAIYHGERVFSGKSYSVSAIRYRTELSSEFVPIGWPIFPRVSHSLALAEIPICGTFGWKVCQYWVLPGNVARREAGFFQSGRAFGGMWHVRRKVCRLALVWCAISLLSQ
jgi:hypothetical protein